MKTFILLIPVVYFDARKTCEHTQGETYKDVQTALADIHEKLERGGKDGEEEPVLVYELSEFMDEVNDQELDNLTNYFMGYVHIK
jgi:hypothetical protein